MKKSFVIFGCSGHARVLLENIQSREEYNFLGWIDPNLRRGSKIFNHPVLGSEEDLKSLYQEKEFSGIVGIGNISIRKKVVNAVLNQIPDFNFINAIHKSAIISPSVNLGKGIAIMPGVIINTESKIEDHSIVNTGSKIDHNCSIGGFVNISPSVCLGGNVNIGAESLIGIGSILSNNLSVPDRYKIKAGTILSKNPD